MKLRLLVTKECNRNCADCCNKDWDLDALPIEENFACWDMIMITGGEPALFLRSGKLQELVHTIRQRTDADIILYTASPKLIMEVPDFLKAIDGMTVTLHSPHDVDAFEALDNFIYAHPELQIYQSWRVNIFKEANYWYENHPTQMFTAKNGLKWIENCPLPKDEQFKRLEDLFKKPELYGNKIKR